MAERRIAGEPLQHVLGHWGFRSLDVVTDRRALIPRPETETLVSLALHHAPTHGPVLAADLGTGTGVIACSLAVELGDRALVVAVDASAGAVSLASENVERVLGETGRERVRVRLGSWFEGLPDEHRGGFDLVVSNPPYLSEREWPLLDAVVRDHDPPEALVAGPTGLEDIDWLVAGARSWLAPGGWLLVEIAPHQAEAISILARDAGYEAVEVCRDLAERDRVLVARWPERADVVLVSDEADGEDEESVRP